MNAFPQYYNLICDRKLCTCEITPIAGGLDTVDSVNIGFTTKSPSGRIAADSIRKRRQANLEPLARKRLLKVPLERIHQPEEDLEAPARQMMAAKHYGIFEDLFGAPHYFLPVAPLHVFYSLEDQDPDSVQPVFYGNHISASHAKVIIEVFTSATVLTATGI
ncbi:unnamed protein product [Dibothriocephalus latus]|uniref:Uncharacterized protein n=1 Tax=Dibothriocephalus latus TaxID=60516 RepID=A0A3P7LZ17_DIBLA|nr:unnamed protein product [Dibothriocephalus latus]